MRRNGFTLAEVLISLGIIAVIVAILMFFINNLKPDKNKILYLKTYNSLAVIIKDFAATTSAFPVCQGDYCFNHNPLYNTSKGLGDKYPDGNSKICNMLSSSFNALDNTCSNVYQHFNGERFSFSNQEGSQFFVSTYRTEPDLDSRRASFQIDIWFDINGDKLPNKIYGEDGCTTPDRFKIMVSSDGTLVAADPMGKAYLSSSKNWLKRSLEIANNNVDENLVDRLRNFDLNRTACPDGYNLSNNICLAAETPQEPGPVIDSTPEKPAPAPAGFFEFDCSDAYIKGQGYAYACGGRTMMETEDRQGNYKDAWETCTALGLRLPTFWEMSAAANYYNELGLSSGNYWGTYETSPVDAAMHNNCYMPTGNCGSAPSSRVQNYRCVRGDWP